MDSAVVDGSVNVRQLSIDDEKLCENTKHVNPKPLELEWILGLNSKVPIVNLTNKNDYDKVFISASAHVLQIFHCYGNKSQCFVGHENEIVSIETDSTGRFIVSADKCGIVNIWDIKVMAEFPHPIRTIYDPYHQHYHHREKRLSKIAFSSDAKNIITASDGNESVIKLWQWSYSNSEGSDNANDTFILPEKYEPVASVRFNSNKNETSMFVITCTNGIVFGQWESKQRKLKRHFPTRSVSISFRFIDTVFIENSQSAVSITKCGSGVIWSNSIVLEISSDVLMKKTNENSYKKEFIKSIKLCENPLTVIKSIDQYIVTADSMGRIRFYDKELKIVFWCPSHDFIDSVVTISFDMMEKLNLDQEQTVRDFLLQTRSEIYTVNFTEMKFTKTFYKSDDFITAIDVFPFNKKLICCANYSGRISLYDYEKRVQVIEHQLKLRKRRSSKSDVDVIEIPHVSALAFSGNGHHLMCGLENGTILCLDVDVLRELRSFNFLQSEVMNIKFSLDSFFMVAYDVKSNMIVMNYDKATEEEWKVVGGKIRYHSKLICDVLFIPHAPPMKPTTLQVRQQHHNKIQTAPRLISLSQDRQIVEYDLFESMKEDSHNLVITFTKRIYQTAIPISMTLIYNSKKHEDQILVADSALKFKIFDKNTFEILATYSGPIYDSYVKQFDANTSFGLTVYSKFFIFSTNKNICIYAMPVDSNPYRSLGITGHCDGIKAIKVDSTRHFLFTIGHKCQSIFMWNINFQVLFDHLNEGGSGLKPYCDLLPGGKYGNLFKDMQNLYYYMLMLSNNNTIDDRIVKNGLDINEVPDYMRALGYFPSDYEIECINHELNLSGKRRLAFDELVKLYINHAPLSNGSTAIHANEVERALRNLCCQLCDDINSADIVLTRENLLKILTDAASEKVELKDAEIYLEKLFQGAEKFMDKISLSDFIHNSLKLNGRIL
ncbi:hypothetical protein PVAND_007554 [Polypedilum vanderplanki]|uniref:Cilia- and flagella-associated protein 251 n=1 Tax=Polypedilum vanderplanki TaxID=319348 RepID=A0A9J6C856_POLVA|nr:hypothetical protein PVAND_007554 [Polypedilum vanderplanki]